MPRSSSHSVMRCLADSESRSLKTSEFTSRPAPVKAASPSQSPEAGAITCLMGKPYLRANSKSRSSCAGTLITAPVP